METDEKLKDKILDSKISDDVHVPEGILRITSEYNGDIESYFSKFVCLIFSLISGAFVVFVTPYLFKHVSLYRSLNSSVLL